MRNKPSRHSESARTIVWVENDIDVMGPVMEPLEKAGFTIIECRNYGEALAHLGDIRNCDLLLLDLILPPGRVTLRRGTEPEFLGLDFLKQLRAQHHFTVPVIVFSVVANNVVSSELLEELKAIPLSKPVRPSELKAAVYELLGLAEN